MRRRLQSVDGFLVHCQAVLEAQRSHPSEERYLEVSCLGNQVQQLHLLVLANFSTCDASPQNVTASLGTWRSFWASRLPYLEKNGFSTDLPRFAVSMLEKAIGEDGRYAPADVTRLREVMVKIKREWNEDGQ